MQMIQNPVSLKAFNTFGIDVMARKIVPVRTKNELLDFIRSREESDDPLLVLGGGSNILFTGDFEGTVLKIENRGVEIVAENEDFVRVKAAAGENWHDFVLWTVEQGLGGLENLAFIPGLVGSSPIQNIGAYGTEMKDCFESLEAVNLVSGETIHLARADCRFGYRDSIFKQDMKGSVVIWSVTFRLSRHPEIHVEYGAIAEELRAMGVQYPGIRDVFEAVIRIRKSKLPDPLEIGNSGSFFKNPVISEEQAEYLKSAYPGLVAYYLPEGGVKLAAGWLIEQCRWKGFRRGDAGVHEKQALVLVNYGKATGAEILELAEEIRQSVLERFDVLLEMEVNVV